MNIKLVLSSGMGFGRYLLPGRPCEFLSLLKLVLFSEKLLQNIYSEMNPKIINGYSPSHLLMFDSL